jgi:hypothetical protein
MKPSACTGSSQCRRRDSNPRHADYDLIGVTIVGAKSLIDREGEIKITLPEIVRVGSAAVAPALVGA